MESGAPAFLGALDCGTLCMVSAGICAAGVIRPVSSPKHDEFLLKFNFVLNNDDFHLNITEGRHR